MLMLMLLDACFRADYYLPRFIFAAAITLIACCHIAVVAAAIRYLRRRRLRFHATPCMPDAAY